MTMDTESKPKKSYLKLNLIIIAVALLFCLFSIPFAIIQTGRIHLIKQLNNAEKQGIPTTIKGLRRIYYTTLHREENGIDVYKEAKQSYVELDNSDTVASTIINGNFLTYRSAENCPEINKFLKKNKKTTALIDRLSNYKIVRQHQNWSIRFRTNYFYSFNEFTYLNKIRCFQALENNDPTLAYSIINNMSKLRELVLSESSLISLDIVSETELIRINLLEDFVNNTNTTNNTLLNEIRELEKIDHKLPEQRKRAFLFEAGIKIVYSLDKPYFSELRLNSTLKNGLLRRVFYNHDFTKFLKLIIPLISNSSWDFYKLKTISDDSCSKAVHSPHYYYSSHSVCQYGRTAIDIAAARSSIRMAKCGLAAELYRRKYSDYPDKLEQLVPEFLDKIPIDPLNGKSFHYFKGNYDYQYEIIPKKSKTSPKPTGMMLFGMGSANNAQKHVNGCYIHSEGVAGITTWGCPGISNNRADGENTFALIRPQKTDKKQGNKAK